MDTSRNPKIFTELIFRSRNLGRQQCSKCAWIMVMISDTALFLCMTLNTGHPTSYTFLSYTLSTASFLRLAPLPGYRVGTTCMIWSCPFIRGPDILLLSKSELFKNGMRQHSTKSSLFEKSVQSYLSKSDNRYPNRQIFPNTSLVALAHRLKRPTACKIQIITLWCNYQ